MSPDLRKQVRMKQPRAVDLFCGAGGLSQGLREAGFAVVGAVEIDPLAASTYRLNHSETTLWECDIRHLSGACLLRALGLAKGELDLLAACPPCQGFSRMRTRNGSRWNKDQRKTLILEVLRFVRALRPRAVMVENVPGLAGDRRYRLFRKGLRSLGYQINWAILDAADFGVPQRRRRLVLLAAMSGQPAFARPSAFARTVRDAIGPSRLGRRPRDPLHNYRPKHAERIQTLIKEVPHDGGSRDCLGRDRQLRCHKKSDGFRDVYGRMSWDSPSPTITSGCINPSKGRFLHPSKDRAITLREAAMLQTFPLGYRFSLERGRYAAALMIGNALPPEFIRRHAVALRKTALT
jgi:DNA (cytosine-5)-methyltransferase 1